MASFANCTFMDIDSINNMIYDPNLIFVSRDNCLVKTGQIKITSESEYWDRKNSSSNQHGEGFLPLVMPSHTRAPAPTPTPTMPTVSTAPGAGTGAGTGAGVGTTQSQPCRFGNKCRHLATGTCNYSHIANACRFGDNCKFNAQGTCKFVH